MSDAPRDRAAGSGGAGAGGVAPPRVLAGGRLLLLHRHHPGARCPGPRNPGAGLQFSWPRHWSYRHIRLAAAFHLRVGRRQLRRHRHCAATGSHLFRASASVGCRRPGVRRWTGWPTCSPAASCSASATTARNSSNLSYSVESARAGSGLGGLAVPAGYPIGFPVGRLPLLRLRALARRCAPACRNSRNDRSGGPWAGRASALPAPAAAGDLLSAAAFIHLVWGRGQLDYILEDMWIGLDKELILSISLFILWATLSRGARSPSA